MKRLVVGISGATGAHYASRLLELVRAHSTVETHLVLSSAAVLSVRQELNLSRQQIHALADVVYSPRDVGATIASGSFVTAGMVIVPCSMRTLAAVAHGLADNLITRAADVTLKERRKLVLVAREAPLNLAHLRNMTAVTEMGGIIYPPVPAFYLHPQNIQELIDQTVCRILELFDIQVPGQRWQGMGQVYT